MDEHLTLFAFIYRSLFLRLWQNLLFVPQKSVSIAYSASPLIRIHTHTNTQRKTDIYTSDHQSNEMQNAYRIYIECSGQIGYCCYLGKLCACMLWYPFIHKLVETRSAAGFFSNRHFVFWSFVQKSAIPFRRFTWLRFSKRVHILVAISKTIFSIGNWWLCYW